MELERSSMLKKSKKNQRKPIQESSSDGDYSPIRDELSDKESSNILLEYEIEKSIEPTKKSQKGAPRKKNKPNHEVYEDFTMNLSPVEGDMQVEGIILQNKNDKENITNVSINPSDSASQLTKTSSISQKNSKIGRRKKKLQLWDEFITTKDSNGVDRLTCKYCKKDYSIRTSSSLLKPHIEACKAEENAKIEKKKNNKLLPLIK